MRGALMATPPLYAQQQVRSSPLQSPAARWHSPAPALPLARSSPRAAALSPGAASGVSPFSLGLGTYASANPLSGALSHTQDWAATLPKSISPSPMFLASP